MSIERLKIVLQPGLEGAFNVLWPIRRAPPRTRRSRRRRARNGLPNSRQACSVI